MIITKTMISKVVASVVLLISSVSADAQFKILVHSGNDTIVLPTNKVDSVSFDLTPDMQAQIKLYKIVKVLTCEKDYATSKHDSIIVDSLKNEITSTKERLEEVLNNYNELQNKISDGTIGNPY